VDAIAQGDGDRAERAARLHISEGFRIRLKMLAKEATIEFPTAARFGRLPATPGVWCVQPLWNAKAIDTCRKLKHVPQHHFQPEKRERDQEAALECCGTDAPSD
jgi:hypothetical protein